MQAECIGYAGCITYTIDYANGYTKTNSSSTLRNKWKTGYVKPTIGYTHTSV